jgi:CRP/FNR family transcriptional regulator
MIAQETNNSARQCPHNATINCNQCSLGDICLPAALKADEINRLDDIVRRRRDLVKGKHLYRTLDGFQSVYAIRSGHIKTYQITEDGEEQVTGFYFPGEIVGLDGIGKNHYTNNAKALDEAGICEIPFTQFQQLTSEFPELQMHFFQLMGKEITSDQMLITLLSKKTAEQRLATFLLTISARKARHNQCSNRFTLPMPRSDIANYLGLTIETVSRIFSRLAKAETITFSNKDIEIIDADKLKELANLDGEF